MQVTDKMVEALLPCPFCGGEAHVWHGDSRSHVGCQTCKADGPPVWHGGPNADRKTLNRCDTEAIAAWNHRAALATVNAEPVTVRELDATIDELAYRFWSIHPKELDPYKESMPEGYKGGVRAWFFAVEMRKLLASRSALVEGGEAVAEARKIIAEMVRLAEMGAEESLKEPEENGNFAVYERAKAYLAATPATADERVVEALDGPEERRIDGLRLTAFRTNSDEDKAAYYLAVSEWFQHRHYRALKAQGGR